MTEIERIHSQVVDLADNDRLRRLEAACAAMRGCLSKLHFHMKYWGSQEDGVPEEMYNDWKAALELVNSPNPGQSLLNEIDRLRRLETAVWDDELVDSCAAKAVSSKPTRPEHTAINIYRAALLTIMKGE